MKRLLVLVFSMAILAAGALAVHAEQQSSDLRVVIPRQWSFSVTPDEVELIAEPGLLKESDPISVNVDTNTTWERSVTWTDASSGSGTIPKDEILGESTLAGGLTNDPNDWASFPPGPTTEDLTFSYELDPNSTLAPGAYTSVVTVEANQL
jgi:hypothetical protein